MMSYTDKNIKSEPSENYSTKATEADVLGRYIYPILDAKTLYQVHLEHPEAYKKISKNMIIVDEGIKYDL